MAGPLETLVELQTTLDELRRSEAQLAGVPDWMQELHAEHQVRKEKIDELVAVAEEAAGERRTEEAAVADAQERLKQLQDKIGLVQNQQQYGALLQEIDGVKTQIKEHEESAFAAMEKAEASKQPLDEEREAFRELDERYADELAKWEAQKPDFAKEVEGLRGRAEVLREQIPPQNLSLFNRLYEKLGGSALAEVQEVARSGAGARMWRCGTCNFSVRPQLVVSIRTAGQIVHCDSCKRILYWSGPED